MSSWCAVPLPERDGADQPALPPPPPPPPQPPPPSAPAPPPPPHPATAALTGREELSYEFSLAPVVDFDTDTEHHLTSNAVSLPSTSEAPSVSSPPVSAPPPPPQSSSGPSQPQTPAVVSSASSTQRGGGKGGGRGRSGGISKRTNGGSARPPGALSHTKLCRDRLNGMFERLRRTLPAAPVGVEVKHKAQVLDYAISVLKTMVRRTSELEIELAVSSNHATMEWVTRLVGATGNFAPVATEVMRVFAKRRSWRLAELWLAQRAAPGAQISLEFGAAVVNDALGSITPTGESVASFAECSRVYSFAPGEGVQGRVWSSLRPEWLAGLSNPNDFVRAPLAQRFGVKTCLAVPVTVTGKIEAVLCFYDTRHRPYDSQCFDLATRLTWALGNAMGGKRAGAIEDPTIGKAR